MQRPSSTPGTERPATTAGSSSRAEALEECQALCRQQQEMLLRSNTERIALVSRNEELKKAHSDAEASITGLQGAMQKLIERDVEHVQRRANLEEQLDRVNHNNQVLAHERDKAREEAGALRAVLERTAQEHNELREQLERLLRVMQNVMPARSKTPSHSLPQSPAYSSSTGLEQNLAAEHAQRSQALGVLVDDLSSALRSLEVRRRSDMAEIEMLRTRELEMRTYMDHQMQLLKRLKGHKHRLESELQELLQEKEESPRGGPESQSVSGDFGVRVSSGSLESRTSVVDASMMGGASAGGGWSLDYSQSPPGLQDLDRQWLITMGQRVATAEDIRVHMEAVLSNPEHPVGRCIEEFSGGTAPLIVELCDADEFTGSELPETIQPIHSFIELMHQTCQTAFPLLRSEEHAEVSLSILERVVLSPFYEHLMVLFFDTYAQKDARYARSVATLRDKTPEELGVARKFVEGASAGDLGVAGRYTPAVEHLQRISKAHGPLVKCNILMEVCRILAKCSGSTQAMGADDTLPLLVFCVVKADVPHFASEMHFIEEFLLEEMACAEAGYFYMCGNAVLEYLLQAEEKMNIKGSNVKGSV